MSKYHIKAAPEGVFAGTYKDDGTWRNVHEVTEEAMEAVAVYMAVNQTRLCFVHEDKVMILDTREVNVSNEF